MILSDNDIRKALGDGRLIIKPSPKEEDIDTTSIDLRIGEPLWIWDPELSKEKREETRINLDQFDYKDFSERYLVEVPKESSGKYLIQPNRVYLASTLEQVEFPSGSKLAGRVEGKSSLGRLGLAIHMTAPMIHCGTGLGIIALEIFNHGPFALEMTPGFSRICQLIIEEVSGEPGERTGRIFMGQKDARG